MLSHAKKEKIFKRKYFYKVKKNVLSVNSQTLNFICKALILPGLNNVFL